MKTIQFTVPGIPQSKGSKGIGRNRRTGAPTVIDSNQNYKAYQDTVRAYALRARPRDWPMDRFYVVGAVFYRHYPGLKPDSDKMIRVTLDALTGALYYDDAQVDAHSAMRWRQGVDDPPCAVITVTATDEIAVTPEQRAQSLRRRGRRVAGSTHRD